MPDSFDSLLTQRSIPQARTNLAEQIIQTALYKKPVETFSVRDFWRAFADLFALPQPALVFACVLIVGLTLGVTYTQDVQTADLADRELAVFLTANNGFSGGSL
ncbi:MAG: hypothetical protein ACT4OY_02540 [Alphaproteobacteria bacterium]